MSVQITVARSGQVILAKERDPGRARPASRVAAADGAFNDTGI
jgi:hypothetical protein